MTTNRNKHHSATRVVYLVTFGVTSVLACHSVTVIVARLTVKVSRRVASKSQTMVAKCVSVWITSTSVIHLVVIIATPPFLRACRKISRLLHEDHDRLGQQHRRLLALRGPTGSTTTPNQPGETTNQKLPINSAKWDSV